MFTMTTPRTPPQKITFRYLPGFLALTIAFWFFSFYIWYAVWRDGNKYGYTQLLSLKVILILIITSYVQIALRSLIATLWRLHWRFTLTPTHLIAVHWLRRKRVEIPWESIVRVRKLPRPWWARGGGGLGVNQIETVDGQTIPFMTTVMLRYQQFLEELRARAVNCREFDPYRSEWEQ